MGLLAVIASLLAWVVFIVFATGSSPGMDVSDPAALLAELNATGGSSIAYGWSGTLGSLLMIPYIVVFQHALRRYSPWFGLATTIFIVGTVLAAMGFMSGALAGSYSLLPMAMDAPAKQAALFLAALFVSLELIEGTWWLGSFLAYGVGVGLFSQATLVTSPVPKWISVVGLVASLGAFAWLSLFIQVLSGVAFPLRLVNLLGIFVWSIAMAVVVRRRWTGMEPAASV